jgi:glycerol-3-phosphate dehydrogenase
MNSFSSINRNQDVGNLAAEDFDIIIIGGGITGAGIALDASIRGFRTLLVEKKDFAWGTSSRSTKLIHGGLRYLKQLEVSLVREVGLERAIVHKNAIHLVRPKKMLLPIVEDGSLGRIMSSIGLWIYDFLADVNTPEKRKMLDKKETLKTESLLREDIILGGGIYYEYRTDDSRLTIEILKKAIEKGALAINYLEATEILYHENIVSGIKAFDHLSKETVNINSRHIVNAAGPWVDTVRSLDRDGIQNKSLLLSKGIHIVVAHKSLPLKQAIYFDVAQDERMIFAIPRDGVCYIGTTDTVYSGKIDNPQPTLEDVKYLLEAVNYMFVGIELSVQDVQSSWCGLRPLINEKGKDSSELSRKDEIFESSSGLISIAGGKLTGYRKMAERLVDLLVKKEKLTNPDKNYKTCKTKKEKVSGGDFNSLEDLKVYRKVLQRYYGINGIQPEAIKHLLFKYGSNTDLILQKIAHINSGKRQEDMIRAEVWYSVNYEMTCTLNDFFIRRTGMLYFERPRIEMLVDIVTKEMAELLNWNTKRIQEEKNKFRKEYKNVLTFIKS